MNAKDEKKLRERLEGIAKSKFSLSGIKISHSGELNIDVGALDDFYRDATWVIPALLRERDSLKAALETIIQETMEEEAEPTANADLQALLNFDLGVITGAAKVGKIARNAIRDNP